jgi:RNA polymerase sigma-70 factor (subfamily 1)
VAARNGSRDAQAQLLESLRPVLLAIAEGEVASELRPKLAASDVVQNTMCQAWQDFASFQGHTRTELIGWLKTILGHAAAGEARRYRQTDKRDLERERSLDKLMSELGHDVADSLTSPSGQVMASEERQRVEAAIRRLSPRHEQAIRLRNHLGLSFAEMGVALSCSDTAARKLWLVAVEKLGYELRSNDSSPA